MLGLLPFARHAPISLSRDLAVFSFVVFRRLRCADRTPIGLARRPFQQRQTLRPPLDIDLEEILGACCLNVLDLTAAFFPVPFAALLYDLSHEGVQPLGPGYPAAVRDELGKDGHAGVRPAHPLAYRRRGGNVAEAGELLGPDIPDGVCQTRYSRPELSMMFNETLLIRFFPHQPLDPRLAEFQWLVVEETSPAASRAGQRALPHLYESWSRDFGAVDPHAGRHPVPVLDALFGLFLAPWEDWHSNDYDWRNFSIPWIHVATDDLFVRPTEVPNANTLNWEDVCYSGDYGEPIEFERPFQLPLYQEAEAHLSGFDQQWWRRVHDARKTGLFETPVEHFFVRAALSDGIDQIMAHMTAIEAAIGLESDFVKKGRASADQMSATRRMAKRVGLLLEDPQAEIDYAALFEIRSGFVHGRLIQRSISSTDRNMARRLARRIVTALVDAANGPAGQGARADFLNNLA